MNPRIERAALLALAPLVSLAVVLLLLWGSEIRRGRAGGEETEAPAATRGELVRSPRRQDREIRSLQATLLASPEKASAHRDLAQALIVRARAEGREVDLLGALEHLELAVGLEPGDPEALRQRAELLTRLGLRTAARRAWEASLGADPDPDSPAAAQARLQLEELGRPTLFERWDREGRDRLLSAAQAGDAESTASLVAAYPTFARVWIEERLLPAWADAEVRGSGVEAPAGSGALRLLGRALSAVLHDATTEDTLAHLDMAEGETRERLFGALRLYGQAMAAYRAFGDEDEKNALLEESGRELEAAGVPLAGWARFYRAVGWHRSRPDVARRQLESLALELEPDRQPALLARVEWMIGTNDLTSNRYEASLEHFDRARELLTASEGPEAAAFVDLLIGEALSKLGESEKSWTARLGALGRLAPGGDAQRLHATLYSSLEVLFLEKRFAAARAWVEELEANARRWGEPIALAEAALQVGRLRFEEGRIGESREAFQRARRAASSILDAGLRRRTTATIDLYEAESLLGTEPQTAAEHLERARPAMLELGYRFQLPRLDWARGRAYLALEERDEAMACLLSSIAEEEQIRREVRDASLRATAFESAQQAFDLLMELELDTPGGERQAFDHAEQSRSRVLLDLVSGRADGRGDLGRPVGLDRLAAELPKDVDLLELAVLPQRLVLWRVRRGDVRRFEMRISKSELETAVEELRSAVDRDASETVLRAQASELGRMLLAPVARDLAPGRALVIVPDRFLGRVPFAALILPKSRSYLLEEHPIIVAPSATTYLVTRQRRMALGDGSPTTVAAVGANHPEEEWLPTVEDEAQSIGDLYPRPSVLLGDRATRATFLAAARGTEVLHFAGHGEDDPAAPGRSRLLFHPSGPRDSGRLLGDEIAAQSLLQTRLAVLAACRSVNAGARGRETVAGVAAAFLAAGVPTVVASLWDTDDRATGELMTAFHRNLRQGFAPGEALRRAQLDLLRSQPRFRSPRYWAGFVVVGAG